MFFGGNCGIKLADKEITQPRRREHWERGWRLPYLTFLRKGLEISPLPFACSPHTAGVRLLRRLKNDVTKIVSNFVKVAIQSPFNDKRYWLHEYSP